MSRFVDIDLARLPPPTAIAPLDFESLRADRLTEVVARLNAAGIPYNVGMLESDPVVKLAEHAAYFELLLRGRINDAVRAVLLSSSWGSNLDHIAADLGVARMIITPATANAPAVMEDDASLRARRQLAVEALSVAGPEGAYLFHALSATRRVGNADVSIVKSAGVYGPTSVREITAGQSPVAIGVPPGEVRVPFISRTGNGAATAADIADVQRALRDDDRRPIADFVIVTAAAITAYTVNAVVRIGPGADAGLIKAQAEQRLAAFTARQHRVGAIVRREHLAGVASIAGVDGLPVAEDVTIVAPTADVDPGAYGAPYCTSITVTVETVDA